MKFISSKVHTIIGLLVGVVLLLAPTLFGFTDNQAASMVPMYVGIFIIISELITTSRLSPLKLVPMRVHLVLDYLTGIFLALSPWLFGFSDAPVNAWMPHVVVGVLVVGYAAFTNPMLESEEAPLAKKM